MKPHLRHIGLCAAGALLEMRRRRDVALAVLFAGLLAGSLALARWIGIDNPSTGTFLLNMGLSLAIGVSQLITLFMAARQIPDELERRTIHPLLARPVRRADVLLGKWAASVLVGTGLFVALLIPVLALVPRLESVAAGTLLQALLLHLLSLAFIAALATAFTLWLPRAPGLLIAAALTFGAGPLLRLSRAFPPFYALPDPGRLDLVVRYTDGIAPLPASDFLLLIAYAVLWTALLLGGAIHAFQRRSL